MNRTAEQLMNLESLAFWLEQQPRNGTFHYWHSGNCLLARYYKEHGFEDARVAITYIRPWGINGPCLGVPSEINEVVYGGPFRLFRTFGGALKRARRALNAETQAYALQEAGAR